MIVYCNGRCSMHARRECHNAHGIDVNHLDEVHEERLAEDGTIVAGIYCRYNDEHDYFTMSEEADYAL